MANATVSRLGLVNNSGTGYDALFLKVFSGEVLTAFSENNVFDERMQTVRTISSGKSAQFPVLGTATAAYHTVGTPLVGANQIKANEKIISIDDLLISQAFITDLEELKNHYDVRATYASELGKALARRYDQNVAKVIANASRASATISGGNGGTVLTLANGNTASANVTGDQYYVSGYKGSSPYDAGLFYCPYVPLQMVRAVGENTFQPKIGFKTRYGMVANPFADGAASGTVTNPGAIKVNSNRYYRRFTVRNLM